MPVPAEDRTSRPSAARKSEVKLLRSPRIRVLGNQTSTMLVETLLNSRSHEMPNRPSTMTNRKNKTKTDDNWKRIDRGWRMWSKVSARQVYFENSVASV